MARSWSRKTEDERRLKNVFVGLATLTNKYRRDMANIMTVVQANQNGLAVTLIENGCQLTLTTTELSKTDNGSGNDRPAPNPDVASVQTDTAYGHKVMYPRCRAELRHTTCLDSCGFSGGNQPRFSYICSGVQAVDGRYASTYQTNYCHVRPTNPEVQISEFPPQRAGHTVSGKGQSNFVVGGQGSVTVEDSPQVCSRTGSPVRSQVYTNMDANHTRAISPSPTRISSFRSGAMAESYNSTLHPSATHHAFADSLRKYPDRRACDRSSEVFERLVNYSNARSFNKSPVRLKGLGGGAEPGNCCSPRIVTELNLYSGSGKTNAAATATALEQVAVNKRLAFNRPVDGDRIPCHVMPAPFYTSPYVSYKEKYKKAEQMFNERIAFPLSTIPSDAVPEDAARVISPGNQPPCPHQFFGAAQETVVQNLRQQRQGEAGQRKSQRKTSLRRLGRKQSVTHTRKTWGDLVKKTAKMLTPENSQQSKNVKRYSPGQPSMTRLQSVLKISQLQSSSATLFSCRSSISTVFSDTRICQPQIRHRQLCPCTALNEETVMRKTKLYDVLSVHQSTRRNSPSQEERIGDASDTLCVVAGETSDHNCCHHVTQNRHSSPKNSAEFLKAEIVGYNDMELYENRSQVAHDIIIQTSVDLSDRHRVLEAKRYISTTCIKTSEEIFLLDERKLHVKNSKSQQIVKPKSVKLDEEILYLLRDVPLKPSKDPKERMIRREVLKKLFKKLRHLTHKMEMTESDEDLVRKIRNCLKSVLDCKRCNGHKHWDFMKSEKYTLTQLQVSNKIVPTHDQDNLLKTLITHWFTSIELKVITSQERERLLKSFIKEQQSQLRNRRSNNAEFREIVEASVIDFLRKLPILTEPECRRTVLIHQLAAKLVVEIIALAKAKQKTNVPVSPRENSYLKVFKDESAPCRTHHKLSMDSAIQLIEKKLRNVITTEMSTFLCDRKIISDVIENLEQDVAGILIESMESLKQGKDETVKSELLEFLQENKCFSPHHAQQLTENLLGSLKKIMATAETKNARQIEKDTGTSGHSTTTIVLHSKSRYDSAKRHHPNDKPGASHNHKNTTEDNIVTDDDVANNFNTYTNTLIQLIENWLILLQVHSVPLAHDKDCMAVVVHDLAHDIAVRQKYLQINPSKRAKSAEETHYFRFQIFKWINKLVAGKNREILSHASQLMSKIQNIPVPLLSKPSEFMLCESRKVNPFLNPTEKETKPSETSTAVSSANNVVKMDAYEEMLEHEIKGWLRELPQEVKHTDEFKADSGIVNLLVKDISKGVLKDLDALCDTVCGVIDEKVPPWVAIVIKRTENKLISVNDCIESLKTRIRNINIPVFGEQARDNKEEKKVLSCKDSYDYSTSYCKVRRVLENWSIRTNFLPSCNREVLSEQLDAFAKSLHDVLTLDLTTCEITRRVKRNISNALYTLPLPSEYKNKNNRRAIVEELWSHLQQDKLQKNVKVKVMPGQGFTVGDVKTETCYQCRSVSSHGSQTPCSQIKNLRFTEPRLNQSMPYSNKSPEDARRYTVSGLAGQDRYDGSDRSLEENMPTYQTCGKMPIGEKPRAPRLYQSQQDNSSRFQEHGRRNNIDSLLSSDVRSPQNREKSPSVRENLPFYGRTTDTNKKDTLRLNKTAQEPSNRFCEERRCHSIGGGGTNRTLEQNQTRLKDGCGATADKQTPEAIYDDLQTYLKDWCQKVPIENLNEKDITKVRQGLLNGIRKQIIKIRSHPLAITDRFLTEDMLDGELESLLHCLPRTPDLSRKKRELIYELMEYVVDNNQRLYDVCSSQSYRQQLKEALDKSLPKPKYTSAEFEILQEILKDDVIDQFIQANYAGIDYNRKMLFVSKIQLQLERLMRELSQKGQLEPVNIDLLRTEVYNALYQIPAPSDETMLEQVKECLVRQEIIAWYKDLPISHGQGEEELHNHTNKILLAKKIIEIEKQADPNNLSVEQNIKHEISKFINKFHLHPGEDLNINFMVDELANRIKNNAVLRDPNLSLPIPPCNRCETKFPERPPLSSTLDPNRQDLGGTCHPDVSGIEHAALPDMSINMEAPRNRMLPQSPQNEYQRDFGHVERNLRQRWKNASSGVKRGAYPQHTTPDETKQWLSLQNLDEVDRENLRQMKLQEQNQQSCGQQTVGQQSEMSAVDTNNSRVQEKNIERKTACNRRTLGTSQMPGTSCADRTMKASDVLFKSVMEWCHQIPFACSYPDNGKQSVRAEIATKLISKIGDLNLDPNVLQDEFLYEGMVCSIVDRILNTVPQSAELSSVKKILKDEIIQRLQPARMLAMAELRVHTYRKEINETITKIFQPNSIKIGERSIVDSVAKEKIADALMEIKFEEKDRRQCKKKLIDAIGKCNDKTTAKKIGTRLQEKLAEALVDLPAPTKEALAEEVEEIKLKNEISEWHKIIPLLEDPYSAYDMQKTNKLISLLAKELHEFEKDSSAVDNYVDLIKTEISHWIKRLPVKPNQTCKVNQLIDDFANQLQCTQKSRRLSLSLPLVGEGKYFANPVSSQSVNLNNSCNETSQQSHPPQNLSLREPNNELHYPSLPCGHAPQTPQVCYRPSQYHQKLAHDSETATDEESNENLKLHCKCRADAPTLPICQEKPQYYFTPPCQLYEKFKHPKKCKRTSKNCMKSSKN